VVVVVAEDRHRRHAEPLQLGGEHLGLLRAAPLGQVPGQQQQVGVAAEVGQQRP
jgi:hypothetical protein